MRASLNEALFDKILKENLPQPENVAGQFCGTEKYPPALEPVFTRRGAAQPHGKAVSDAEGGKDTGAGIRHQCGIVVFQGIAADENQKQQQAGNYDTPESGMGSVGPTGR